MSKEHSQKGFAALISITLLAVILFGMTLSLSQFGIVSRFGLLLIEQKHTSHALAESCVHYAEIFIANDPEYTLTIPSNLPVGDESCTLVEVTKTGTTHTIKARGVVDRTTTNLITEIDTKTGVLISWQEVNVL